MTMVSFGGAGTGRDLRHAATDNGADALMWDLCFTTAAFVPRIAVVYLLFTAIYPFCDCVPL